MARAFFFRVGLFGQSYKWVLTRRPELRFDPNHTHPNPFPLSLRIFRSRFLRELFRFEGFRQEGDLAVDVIEQEPLNNRFGHPEFIVRDLAGLSGAV